MRFLADMRERLAKFALTLHGEKTRLVEFGRFAAKRRSARGEGKPETFFFEKDSGLLVRISAILATAMGDIATEATMSDFRSVDGILTPFAITEKAMSQNILMRFNKIAYNAEIPKDRFALPASVKAKQDRKK